MFKITFVRHILVVFLAMIYPSAKKKKKSLKWSIFVASNFWFILSSVLALMGLLPVPCHVATQMIQIALNSADNRSLNPGFCSQIQRQD